MALEQTRFTVLGLNPNDLATFIVVIILSLPILLKVPKYGNWFVWPAEAILMALLIGTGSRGGVLALICGSIIWVAVSWRCGLLAKRRITWIKLGLVFLCSLLIGLAAFPKGFRLGTVDISPEASAGRRLEVWSFVPAMLASAPNGWGFGNSAEAYEQWFEPVGEEVALKHLLSSHLTWLVELGYPWRWLYVFGCVAAILLLLPEEKFQVSSLGVAVWVAFLVALFYNASGKWWNWPIPALWVIIFVALRFRERSFPSGIYWILSVIFAGITVGLPFAMSGMKDVKLPIKGSDGGNMVTVGAGIPRVAILEPSKGVLGTFYGQEIRRELLNLDSRAASTLIVFAPDAKAGTALSSCQLFVITGLNEEKLKRWEPLITPTGNSQLLLINCRVDPDGWMRGFGRVIYSHGEFYGDSFCPRWKEISVDYATIAIQSIPRSEFYIPDWWSLVVEARAE